jgi:hypothetical protein
MKLYGAEVCSNGVISVPSLVKYSKYLKSLSVWMSGQAQTHRQPDLKCPRFYLYQDICPRRGRHAGACAIYGFRQGVVEVLALL